MPRLTIWVLLAALLQTAAGSAQTLTVQPQAAKVGEPIVATLGDLEDIQAPSTYSVAWDHDKGVKTLPGPDGMLHVWATGGKHFLGVTVTKEIREEIRVIIPGPNWDTDKSDAKIGTIINLKDKVVVPLRVEFNVAGPGPTPDPEPGPEPNPDDDPPIPGDSLRVLVLYESGATVPEAQLQTIYSTAIRAAVIEKKGEIRFYDPDVTPEVAWAVEAMKRPRTSLPWWIYSNGKTGGEGPLPDEKTVLETLKKL